MFDYSCLIESENEIAKCAKVFTVTNQHNTVKIKGFIIVSNLGDAIYVGKNHRNDSSLEEGIKISKDNRRHIGKYLIYQLVADCFCDKSEASAKCKNPQAHHIDFNKLNDRADNLIWLTPSQHLSIHNRHSKSGVKFTEKHKNNMKKSWAKKIKEGYELTKEQKEKQKLNTPRGPRNLTEEQRNKISEQHKNNTNVLGTKHIHKGSERKMVLIDELDKYLAEGWELGRGKLK